MERVLHRRRLYRKTIFSSWRGNLSIGLCSTKKWTNVSVAACEPMAMQPAIACQNGRGVWLYKSSSKEATEECSSYHGQECSTRSISQGTEVMIVTEYVPFRYFTREILTCINIWTDRFPDLQNPELPHQLSLLTLLWRLFKSLQKPAGYKWTQSNFCMNKQESAKTTVCKMSSLGG